MKYTFALSFGIILISLFSSCDQAAQVEQDVKKIVNGEVEKTIKDLGLTYVEEGAQTIITYDEVNAAQQAWCDGLVKIGELYSTGGDYKSYTSQLISDAYNYDLGKVFFKPTLTYGDQTFRTTKEGAMAYFIGGDPNYPSDNGFALKPWTKVTFDNLGEKNEGIQIYGSVAITMGNVYLTAADGTEVMVDKTFVFKKGKDGKLRLIVHKSALPFNPKAS